MSKYYVDKFLFMVDRDPELLKRYAEEPRNFVATWEQSIGPKLIGNDVEASSVHAFTPEEREEVGEPDTRQLSEKTAMRMAEAVGEFIAASFDAESEIGTLRTGRLGCVTDLVELLRRKAWIS